MGVDRQDVAEPRLSKTGESEVVVECRKGANAFRRKPRWGTMTASALRSDTGNGQLVGWPGGAGPMPRRAS